MSTEDRLKAIEERLRAAEDHLEILNLISAYGPLADSCCVDEAAGQWIEGGGYNYGTPGGGTQRLEAPEAIRNVWAQQGHIDLTRTGSAHMAATPKISVRGDAAQAVGYSLVIKREGDRWFVWRAAINHWTLVRTPEGWRVQEKFNRTLDGSDESHEVMRRILAI
ncbi:MAG: nuclear transport factor 2 family protein [Novosphingobium sp.]